MYKVRNARNSLCWSTQFRLSIADAAKLAQLSVTARRARLQLTACGRKKTTSGAWRYCLIHVVRPLTMSCTGDTVTNNKADTKSPPPVILTASRRLAVLYQVDFKSPVSHIFHQSVTFLYVTDSGD